MFWAYLGSGIAVLMLLVVVFDVTQRTHTILHNFPIIGHFRYILERIGPELRQYIVTDNDEERPFTRDQRRWVYASAKRQNNRFGFGSDNEMERSSNYLIIKHDAFPPLIDPKHSIENDRGHDPFLLPAAKIMGLARGRRHAFRPESVVNISGMSFGALSGRAVEALNRGARLSGCMQTTGEGGISPYHLNGGDLVFQIGTGYFGCRDRAGRFSLDRLAETIEHAPVKAIEIKLSQGAKPGLGGILPGVKVNAEIARIRGVPQGQDCISPPGHSAFRSADELLDFIEAIGERTGLPVGIKSAVGKLSFWRDLADLMSDGPRGVDYIVIDGGEGGTGAAPLAFTDHVSLPLKIGLTRVFSTFAERSLDDRVVFIVSGKAGLPEAALMSFSLGADMVNVGREAMLAVGCIQSQRCHTGNCPTGVTTHKRWRTAGLDPSSKGVRTANYISTLRGELLALSRTCGQVHPALVGAGQLELVDGRFGARSLAEVFDYQADWGVPQNRRRDEIESLMRDAAPQAAGLADTDRPFPT
ncbi:MAG: FMN-binding glutamate synthase family protein [Actinobacteria bacterium]|nr:FMN-binding glutamate synthase family protein [Actinomycetota bacterium]